MLSERATFCFEVLEKISVEDDFLPNIVFRNEATFHLSGTLYDRSVQMWGRTTQLGIAEGGCALCLSHKEVVFRARPSFSQSSP